VVSTGAQVLQCTLISRQLAEMEIEATPDGSGNVVPTFTPSHYERAISTRATASNMERRQRALHVPPLHPSPTSPLSHQLSWSRNAFGILKSSIRQNYCVPDEHMIEKLKHLVWGSHPPSTSKGHAATVPWRNLGIPGRESEESNKINDRNRLMIPTKEARTSMIETVL
jgi:hypothetical protein